MTREEARKEAIETLKENLCALCAYGSQDMDSCDIRSCDNKDAIKALEQEPKWIPVSEKLPSDCNEDWVLAHIQEDNGYLWKIPCVAEYRKDTDDWYSDVSNIGWLKNHRGFFKVIAWMPLPEPYKAESEVQDADCD